MKQSEKRVMELVLDDGGPFTIWQEADSEGRRCGLFITALVCNNPDCDCRDIWLRAVQIDERYTNIEDDGKSFNYAFIPRDGESMEPPPLRSLSAGLNVDSGRIDFSPHAPAERQDPELLARLREGLSPSYLERLRKRWRLAKGINRDVWRQRDWSWWKPGDLVSWFEVHPDDFNLIFDLDGSVYLADDMYCINPGCSCKEVGLAFSRVSTEGVENVGAISVTLPSCRFSGVMGEEGNEKLLRQLWSTMRERPEFRTILKDRMKRIKPVGQEIVRLSAGKPSPNRPSQPSQLKAGRNDPCPCGSGKKYKKCCLGKS